MTTIMERELDKKKMETNFELRHLRSNAGAYAIGILAALIRSGDIPAYILAKAQETVKAWDNATDALLNPPSVENTRAGGDTNE